LPANWPDVPLVMLRDYRTETVLVRRLEVLRWDRGRRFFCTADGRSPASRGMVLQHVLTGDIRPVAQGEQLELL